MKHLLLTTIAAVVLVGCGPSMSIHDAARDGNIEVVKQHLAAGTDVNAKDENSWTPLHSAAFKGHKEIAELLIAKSASVNAKNGFGLTPLHSAAASGRKEIVELLIAKGADVNAKDEDGETPLDATSVFNEKETADLLREHGGKSGAVDSIHVAAGLGNIEAVKQHLAAGADVNAKDDWGETPLHFAADKGHKEVAELLIAEGADVNAKNMGELTPLHYAAIHGRTEVVELLIAEGADVNAKSEWGDTPLDYAETNNFEPPELKAAKKEIADLLRKHELNQLMPRLVQHGRFAFSFDAKEGKVYKVQDSFDLLNWEVIKTYTGTGTAVRFDEERDHDPPKIFYRVKVVE